MDLIYGIHDKPKFGQMLVFALQQLLAIITATIIVPFVVNSTIMKPIADGGMGLSSYVPFLDPAAALVGAGFGTITYLCFTKFRSPVFLGSSFAFIPALCGAAVFGYYGVLLGAAFAMIVYVLIAIVVKLVGTKWIDKLMPPVVIGPTVALIGLSLAGNAMGNLQSSSATGATYNLVAILCGLVTFFIICACSIKGTKTMKLIPFIIGILGGYVLAAIFTGIGTAANVPYLQITNFQPFVDEFKEVTIQSFLDYPKFSFLANNSLYPQITGGDVANIALLYLPLAFVVFAEHIADHKNISNIIGTDLLKNPGLDKTLLGDGVGSFVGSIFGGCPNTTYGESIGCVAITRNASVSTIFTAAILAILVSFITPIMAFINTIPACVMGGACLSLYGFIAVSGLTMLRNVDLGESKNLFVVASILIAGIGGLSLKFGDWYAVKNPAIVISPIATALVIGIIVNAAFGHKDKKQTIDTSNGDSVVSANAAAAAKVSNEEAEKQAIEELVEKHEDSVQFDELIDKAEK